MPCQAGGYPVKVVKDVSPKIAVRTGGAPASSKPNDQFGLSESTQATKLLQPIENRSCEGDSRGDYNETAGSFTCSRMLLSTKSTDLLKTFSTCDVSSIGPCPMFITSNDKTLNGTLPQPIDI